MSFHACIYKIVAVKEVEPTKSWPQRKTEMCHAEYSVLKHYDREYFPKSDYNMSLEEWIYELSPHYILTSLGEELEVLVLEYIPPPVFWPELVF